MSVQISLLQIKAVRNNNLCFLCDRSRVTILDMTSPHLYMQTQNIIMDVFLINDHYFIVFS